MLVALAPLCSPEAHVVYHYQELCQDASHVRLASTFSKEKSDLLFTALSSHVEHNAEWRTAPARSCEVVWDNEAMCSILKVLSARCDTHPRRVQARERSGYPELYVSFSAEDISSRQGPWLEKYCWHSSRHSGFTSLFTPNLPPLPHSYHHYRYAHKTTLSLWGTSCRNFMIRHDEARTHHWYTYGWFALQSRTRRRRIFRHRRLQRGAKRSPHSGTWISGKSRNFCYWQLSCMISWFKDI